MKLSDLRGKVVVLNFWATWCGPCALEIPWFIEFEQQFKSKGLEIVGVSMDEDGWKAIKPYVASHKMNYRVVLGNDSVGQLYGGVDSLPTTFVIDREGRLAFPPHVGLPGKNEYLNEIQTLLDEKQEADSRAFIPGNLLLGSATQRLTVEPPSQVTVKRGEEFSHKLSISIQPGFHVNSNKPKDEFLIPLQLTWAPGPLTAESVSYPQAEEIKVGPDTLSVFTGKVVLETNSVRAIRPLLCPPR